MPSKQLFLLCFIGSVIACHSQTGREKIHKHVDIAGPFLARGFEALNQSLSLLARYEDGLFQKFVFGEIKHRRNCFMYRQFDQEWHECSGVTLPIIVHSIVNQFIILVSKPQFRDE
nr:unnamed protein product [Spirometra erinaceieuropaei]